MARPRHRARHRRQLPRRALGHVAEVLVRLGPRAVEPPLAVRALVGMAPEEVALRLLVKFLGYIGGGLGEWVLTTSR